MISRLSPTKQRTNKKKIYGFDIETYNDNKDFYCATIYGDDYIETFFDKQSVIDVFKNRRFRNSFIVATNLGFDFFGCFYGSPELKKFRTISRGSNIICAKTKVRDNKYCLSGKGQAVTFIDTMNYASLSVENMGNILKIPKLDKPKALGKFPKSDDERKELIKYNIRDAEISKRFMEFLFDGFTKLGASPKMTIASTSMSLFRNKYLNDTYYVHSEEDLLFQFEGYYGGRTECFSRGKVNEYNYYDFNSLYPSVMHDNDFPDPNSLRKTSKDTDEYIMMYEGISDITINIPMMDYPPLPFRTKEKLIFPTGTFRGKYTHTEIRYAISLGATLMKTHRTFYFKKKCSPFNNYVDDLYNKRREYKEQKSDMQLVVKLCLNSLYGKFGEKFRGKDNLVSTDITYEELMKYETFERIGDFFRVKEDKKPALHCFPIWASYITAYARIKLHKAMQICKPIYVDTDSLVTVKKMNEGIKLGELELEYQIKEGYFIKPKMYAFIDIHDKPKVKLKGIGGGVTYEKFIGLLDDPKAEFIRFTKIREALRRNMTPNELQIVQKILSLNDDKRVWKSSFISDTFQSSIPHTIIEGMTEIKYIELMKEIQIKEESEILKQIVTSDHYDNDAKGGDISDKEYIENEKWFNRFG